MVRHFLANLSFLVILNILVKPLYIFGIEVAVQNTVGPSAYGLYFAVLNSAYLLQIVNDFGLQIYNNRLVALDAGQIHRSFRSIVRLKLLLGALFVILLAGLAFILGYQRHLLLVGLVASNMLLVSFLLFLRSNISGLGHYRLDSILSVTDKSLMIIICGALLLARQDLFTIYDFLYAQLASLAFTVLLAFGLLIRHTRGIEQTNDKIRLRSIFTKAAPYALGVFLMTVYTRVDGVMIEQLAADGEYQSGLYAAGYRLLDAFNMFAFLFAVLLLPMFSRLTGDREQTIHLLDQGYRLMGVVTVAAAASCFAFSEEIMSFLYPASTVAWSRVFSILILSFVGVGMMYIFGTLLTARGRMRELNVIYISCVVTNVIANALLIPRFGALGAAIATLITQGLAAALLIVMVIRLIRIDNALKPTIASGMFLGLSLLATGFMSELSGESYWFGGFILSATAIVAVAFALGFLKWSELSALIRQ